jgi:hypothetical protein
LDGALKNQEMKVKIFYLFDNTCSMHIQTFCYRIEVCNLETFNYFYVSISSSCLPSKKKKVKTEIYKTIILPVVLYEYETYSLAVQEEYLLMVLITG